MKEQNQRPTHPGETKMRNTDALLDKAKGLCQPAATNPSANTSAAASDRSETLSSNRCRRHPAGPTKRHPPRQADACHVACSRAYGTAPTGAGIRGPGTVCGPHFEDRRSRHEDRHPHADEDTGTAAQATKNADSAGDGSNDHGSAHRVNRTGTASTSEDRRVHKRTAKDGKRR